MLGYSKLKKAGTPFVIRIKKPNDDIVIANLLGEDITIPAQEVDAFVILRADGTPTKIFASACDDMLSGITVVLEEKSHVLNAARSEHIKAALGYSEKTMYAHIPSLLNAPTILELFEQGYIPDAILNYLILVGFPKLQAKIFTLPEAISSFRLENISSSNVTFNKDELRFMNRAHLKRMDNKLLSSLFGFADAEVGKLVKLYLEEAATINELALKIRPIFAPKDFGGIWENEMYTLQKIIVDAPMFNKYDDFLSYIGKESKLEGATLLKPLRLLLTGSEYGPQLSDIYPLIKPYLLEVVSS